MCFPLIYQFIEMGHISRRRIKTSSHNKRKEAAA